MMRTTLNTARDLYTEYDECAFHTLLGFEHQLCPQTGHAFHMLLCRLSTQDGLRFRMDQSARSVLMAIVRESLRRTDQMGWLLQDLIFGVLLVNTNPHQATVLNTSGTAEIRRQIEMQLSLVHPSLVVQFYEYLDLPSMYQFTGSGAPTHHRHRQD